MSDCIITRRGRDPELESATITANGTYTSTKDGFSSVFVNVSSGDVAHFNVSTISKSINAYIWYSGNITYLETDSTNTVLLWDLSSYVGKTVYMGLLGGNRQRASFIGEPNPTGGHNYAGRVAWQGTDSTSNHYANLGVISAEYPYLVLYSNQSGRSESIPTDIWII